jgi:hypothetical protein
VSECASGERTPTQTIVNQAETSQQWRGRKKTRRERDNGEANVSSTKTDRPTFDGDFGRGWTTLHETRDALKACKTAKLVVAVNA